MTFVEFLKQMDLVEWIVNISLSIALVFFVEYKWKLITIVGGFLIMRKWFMRRLVNSGLCDQEISDKLFIPIKQVRRRLAKLGLR